MRLAIMQPYIFPYIGYFQLINAVDGFVVYDNIEFTKKGWINRNRILLNGKDVLFTIPLKKDSDYLDVNERCLSENASKEISKIVGQIRSSYAKAPCFKEVFPLVEHIFLHAEKNLFHYILNSIQETNKYLSIVTPVIISSELKIDHSLKAKDKVISICKEMKADTYLNPIGGAQLYSKENFKKEGIDLQFLKTNEFSYKQFDNEFIPFLSIIDVMMFNSKEEIKKYLNSFYTLA